MEVGIAYNQTNFFFTTSIQRLETYGLPHGVNIDNYIRQIIAMLIFLRSVPGLQPDDTTQVAINKIRNAIDNDNDNLGFGSKNKKRSNNMQLKIKFESRCIAFILFLFRIK